MHLHTLLGQADWRLRAYLQTLDQEEPAGWRQDASLCPIALWIEKELGTTGAIVTETRVIADVQTARTPLLLALFIGLVDAGEGEDEDRKEQDPLAGHETLLSQLAGQCAAHITGHEALLALQLAERRAAQLVLPRRADSQQCAYADQDGQRCEGEAQTPWLHAFYTHQQLGTIQRADCTEFRGVMCAAHWSHVVCPPADWYEDDTPCPAVVPVLVDTEAEEVLV